MSKNKDVYRRCVKCLGTRDDREREAELDAVLNPPFIAHGLEQAMPPGGVDALKAFRRRVKQAFPDQQMAIEDWLEEGDRAASRQRLTGTHLGPYLDITATGAPLDVELFEITGIQDGKILERWCVCDRGGRMNELRAAVAAD